MWYTKIVFSAIILNFSEILLTFEIGKNFFILLSIDWSLLYKSVRFERVFILLFMVEDIISKG